MIFLASKCGARIAVPAQTIAEAARMMAGVLNSDHAVTHSAEGVQVGRFAGAKLEQVWEFNLAKSVAFVSPVAWQEGLRSALSAQWRLAV